MPNGRVHPGEMAAVTALYPRPAVCLACDEARRGGDHAEWWVAPDRAPLEPPGAVAEGVRFVTSQRRARRPRPAPDHARVATAAATNRTPPGRGRSPQAPHEPALRESRDASISGRAGTCRPGRVSSCPTKGA